MYFKSFNLSGVLNFSIRCKVTCLYMVPMIKINMKLCYQPGVKIIKSFLTKVQKLMNQVKLFSMKGVRYVKPHY